MGGSDVVWCFYLNRKTIIAITIIITFNFIVIVIVIDFFYFGLFERFQHLIVVRLLFIQSLIPNTLYWNNS